VLLPLVVLNKIVMKRKKDANDVRDKRLWVRVSSNEKTQINKIVAELNQINPNQKMDVAKYMRLVALKKKVTIIQKVA